jgi:hypothetical protein
MSYIPTTSNYNTPNWGINQIYYYNQTGFFPFSSGVQELFVSTNRPGVYLINGNPGNCVFYPVFCSASNISNLGIPQTVDDAYLVYPGFGIQLFYDINYNGTNQSSFNYFNSGNAPVIFRTTTSWPGAVLQIKGFKVPSGALNNDYQANKTKSIYVYFRSTTPVTISGLS